MQISCPHCSQFLEIDKIWLGHAITCPLCEHVFTAEIPTDEFPPENLEIDPIPIAEVAPLAAPLPSLPRSLPKDLPSFMPATNPPRPPAPPMPTPPPQKKKSGAPFILFLILLCGGGFGYGMIHYQESPQGFLSHIKRVPLMLLQLPPEQTLRKLSNFCGLTSSPKLSPTPAPAPSPIQEGTPAPDPMTQGNPTTPPTDTNATPQSTPTETKIETPFGTRQ